MSGKYHIRRNVRRSIRKEEIPLMSDEVATDEGC